MITTRIPASPSPWLRDVKHMVDHAVLREAAERVGPQALVDQLVNEFESLRAVFEQADRLPAVPRAEQLSDVVARLESALVTAKRDGAKAIRVKTAPIIIDGLAVTIHVIARPPKERL